MQRQLRGKTSLILKDFIVIKRIIFFALIGLYGNIAISARIADGETDPIESKGGPSCYRGIGQFQVDDLPRKNRLLVGEKLRLKIKSAKQPAEYKKLSFYKNGIFIREFTPGTYGEAEYEKRFDKSEIQEWVIQDDNRKCRHYYIVVQTSPKAEITKDRESYFVAMPVIIGGKREIDPILSEAKRKGYGNVFDIEENFVWEKNGLTYFQREMPPIDMGQQYQNNFSVTVSDGKYSAQGNIQIRYNVETFPTCQFGGIFPNCNAGVGGGL